MAGRAVPAASAEASSRASIGHRPRTGGANARSEPASPLGGDVLLNLLGGFALTQAGVNVEPPTSARRVVAFLALQGRRLHRLYVAGNLWPDVSESHANASLRTALWRLRSSGCDVIESGADHLAVLGHVRVDIWDLEAQASEVLATTDVPPSQVVARFCLAGELLPDWYDEWLLIERERFHQLRLHALETLSERLTVCGRLSEAMEAAQAAVGAEPLRESAHRALIRVYQAEGNRSEALRQYALFRGLLQEKLGIEPSPQIQEMVSPAFML